MSSRLLHARWPWFTAAALLGLVYLSTLVEIRPGDPRPRGSLEDIDRLSRAQGPQGPLHSDRHAASGPADRLGLQARDESDDRLAGVGRRALRAPALAVVVDKVLDGLAVDLALPAAHRRAALRPGAVERGEAARRDPPRGGIPYRRPVPQRLGGPELRLLSGVRGLPPARESSAHGERAAPESNAAGQRFGHERGRGLSLVPERLCARALVRLSPPDGRTPVHVRPAVGDLRHLDLGHLRQLDPARGRPGEWRSWAVSPQPAYSTRR